MRRAGPPGPDRSTTGGARSARTPDHRGCSGAEMANGTAVSVVLFGEYVTLEINRQEASRIFHEMGGGQFRVCGKVRADSASCARKGG